MNSWVASFSGADYYLETISERHAIVKRTTHDTKICCYGCIVFLATIFASGFILSKLPSQVTLSGYLSSIAIGVMVIPLFMGWYCLYPNKVEFDIQFIGQGPVRVRVTASGNMLAQTESEYQSFLRTISPLHGGSGIDLS